MRIHELNRRIAAKVMNVVEEGVEPASFAPIFRSRSFAT